MKLSFDEWNIWSDRFKTYDNWDFAKPRLEQTYNLADALAFGINLRLLNNADRVKWYICPVGQCHRPDFHLPGTGYQTDALSVSTGIVLWKKQGPKTDTNLSQI